MNEFERKELVAASHVIELATAHVVQYALAFDRDAATVAVLMAALEIVYKRTRQVDPNQWAFENGLESF